MNLQFQTLFASRIAHIVYHLEQSKFRHTNEHQKSRAFVLLAKDLLQTANLSEECEFIEANNLSDVSAIRLIPLKLIYSYPSGFHDVYKFNSKREHSQTEGIQYLSEDEFTSETNRLVTEIKLEYSAKLENLDSPKPGDGIVNIFKELQSNITMIVCNRALEFIKQCSMKVVQWSNAQGKNKSIIDSITYESVKNGAISIKSESLSIDRKLRLIKIQSNENGQADISFEIDFKKMLLKSGRFYASLSYESCQGFDVNLDVQSTITKGLDRYYSDDQIDNFITYLYAKGFDLSDSFQEELGFRKDNIQIQYLAKYRSLEPLTCMLKKFNERIPSRKPIYNVNVLSDLFKQFRECSNERIIDFSTKFISSGIDIDHIVQNSYPTENPNFIQIAENVLAKTKESKVYSSILTIKLTQTLDRAIEELILDEYVEATEDYEDAAVMSL